MGTTGQSITLANSIIGVGILAMPFCFQQCGVLLATLILLSMGLVSRLCCYYLIKSAIITRRRNYEFLAFHVFGPAGKIAVETGIIGFLMGTCIAYFVVVGDLGPQIIAKLLNINQSDILRTSIMVIVSLVCVLPLGLLRNVDSLSNVSAATIAFYFCLVIKVITEAVTQLLASDWPTIEMWRPAGVLQCVPIFSMALFCQTQLFEIFESMPSLSLEKMSVVTKNAIHICAGVYFTLGLFGYMAFGSQEISGNILMSLSPTWASDVIKLGFVMSLAFSFPLIIFPCRASLYSFLYRKVQPSQHDHIINHSIPEGTFRLMTVGIVGLALVVSLLLPNVELVLGLLGATIGVLVCVVFPAACFVHVTFKDTNERVLAKFVVVLGLIILVLGTYANLQAAENTRDKYDDLYITQERIDKIVEDYFQKKAKAEAAIVTPNLGETLHIGKNKILESEIIKDSEVQPPNPVPPQLIETNAIEVKDEKKLMVLSDNEKKILEDSNSHPRNIKLKSNEDIIAHNQIASEKSIKNVKEINGDSLKKVENNEKLLNEDTNILNEENDVNNQDKLDIIKQQHLMETIKQHGQEQKELIKEQKEILNEILKTKKELHESKKEVDSNEAKKIAVESIQKIANMAIQSIGGVTEKPVNHVQAKQPDLIENIANEAVHDIAKKAAETLNAIKHIEDDTSNKNNMPIDKDDSGDKIKTQKRESNIPVDNKNINKNLQSRVSTNNEKFEASQNLNNGAMYNEVHRPVGVNLGKPDAAAMKVSNPPSAKPNIPNQKDTLESQRNDRLNRPLPIVLSDKEREIFASKVKIQSHKINPQDNVNKDIGIISINKEETVIRQDAGRLKREAIDCKDPILIKSVNSLNKPVVKEISDDILQKIDLGESSLAKNLPLSVYNIRSLKSIQEDNNR